MPDRLSALKWTNTSGPPPSGTTAEALARIVELDRALDLGGHLLIAPFRIRGKPCPG